MAKGLCNFVVYNRFSKYFLYMKLLRSYLFQTLAFVVAVAGMHSCSCEKHETVESKIDYVLSDSVAVAFAGDIERFFQALDVVVDDGVAVMPEYMSNVINTLVSRQSRKDIEDVLANLKGLGYTNFVGGIKSENHITGLVVFDVEDEGDFVKSFKGNDESFAVGSCKGFDTVGNDRFAILVKDHLGFIAMKNGRIMSGLDAVEIVNDWIEDAWQVPLSAWKKERLTSPHVANALCTFAPLLAQLPSRARAEVEAEVTNVVGSVDNWYGMMFDLDGENMLAGLSVLTADGKQTANTYKGKFDAELLKYSGKNDIFGCALALNESGRKNIARTITNVLNQQGFDDGSRMYVDQIVEAVEQVSENVSDGGAFFAMGFSDDVDTKEFDPLDLGTYHFVLAADLKPETAEAVYNRLCQNVEREFGGYGTVTRTDNSMQIKVMVDAGYDFRQEQMLYSEYNLYVELQGQTVVMSNGKPTKRESNNFTPAVFDGSIMAAQISIPQNFPAFASFDITNGLNVTISVKEKEATFGASLKGTNGKFVPGIFKIVTGLM